MVMAAHFGEAAAVRLHATELLLLLGTAIVLVVERPAKAESEPEAESMTCELALEQPQLLHDR
jgi:hypothetical protein